MQYVIDIIYRKMKGIRERLSTEHENEVQYNEKKNK